jgi:cell wall-associated NlpC family hydrolase
MKKIIRIGIIILVLMLIPFNASAQYYVQRGDTLWSISRKLGMSYQDLKLLNPQIANPNLIRVGDFIVTRSNNKAQDIVEYARSLQDITVYVYGGQQAPYKTDCSGWVQHVYAKFGIKLPRVSRDQAKVGIPVTFKNLRMGDLMFFSTRADKVITHSGIYMGNAYWISNLNAEKDVTILSTWGTWAQRYFLWGQRVL